MTEQDRNGERHVYPEVLQLADFYEQFSSSTDPVEQGEALSNLITGIEPFVQSHFAKKWRAAEKAGLLDADDIQQETMLALYNSFVRTDKSRFTLTTEQKADRKEAALGILRWSFAFVDNHARSRYRLQKRRQGKMQQVQTQALQNRDSGSTSESYGLPLYLHENVERMIEDFRQNFIPQQYPHAPQYRTYFDMRHAGQSIPEIVAYARSIGDDTEEGTIRARLFRMRNHLEKNLRQLGLVKSSDFALEAFLPQTAIGLTILPTIPILGIHYTTEDLVRNYCYAKGIPFVRRDDIPPEEYSRMMRQKKADVVARKIERQRLKNIFLGELQTYGLLQPFSQEEANVFTLWLQGNSPKNITNLTGIKQSRAKKIIHDIHPQLRSQLSKIVGKESMKQFDPLFEGMKSSEE